MVFNTRVNVYSQGNRKCNFVPGCACFICIDLLISCALKINDDADDDDDNSVKTGSIVMVSHCDSIQTSVHYS